MALSLFEKGKAARGAYGRFALDKLRHLFAVSAIELAARSATYPHAATLDVVDKLRDATRRIQFDLATTGDAFGQLADPAGSNRTPGGSLED